MAQEPLSPWVPIIVTAVVQGAAGVYSWFSFFRTRSEKRTETVSELRDRLWIAKEAQSDAAYTRLSAENKRLSDRLREIERDRDRGWDLARWWNSETHRVKHALLNAVHAANLSLEIGGRPTVNVPEIVLPSIEEPVLPHGDLDV